MTEEMKTLKQWVEESEHIVFFGGAGVSTESGIPDFRSVDGLYNQKYDYPPETILSRSFFNRNPEAFFRFYRDKLLLKGVRPSRAHIALAKLEKAGKLDAVVTQNIDGLHQDAGSEAVYELHGSTRRNYCMRCRRFYTDDDIRGMDLIPKCSCGGIIKPDVVLYEESLDGDVIEKSVRAIENADLLIVGGTSLTVYPAAGLIRYFRGKRLVIINKSETSYDEEADLAIYDSVGEALEYAVSDL
ncbi:MAG: NAD-dependent protein deacylase [Ruminococcaceae bacterium]|jgi:NAD-dependent deacetylase|nr:NAD-dependent protein deacylase [Oscillospiraceae bacterium]